MLDYVKLKNVLGTEREETVATNLANHPYPFTQGYIGGWSKVFDAAWWALTGTWPSTLSGGMAVPCDRTKPASIEFRYTTGETYKATFNRKEQNWKGKGVRPYYKGFVLYFHLNGTVSVWDNLQHLPRKGHDLSTRIMMGESIIWRGRESSGKPVRYCNGIFHDLNHWRFTEDGERFKRILQQLILGAEIGPSERISIDDITDHPTLVVDGYSVPFVHANYNTRWKIVLAYVLTWAWGRHLSYAKHYGVDPTKNVTILVEDGRANVADIKKAVETLPVKAAVLAT